MAYTDIPTVSVGDLYTASDFNTYLRDNFRAGVPDAFTAQGGIAFGAGADTIGVLTLGTAGQWLEAYSAGSLGVRWATPTGFFDMFTFGAFTCATLDNLTLPTLAYANSIVDVHTSFGISDTTAKFFLTSLSVRRTADGAAGYSHDDHVALNKTSDTTELYILARALGTGAYEASNIQTGLMVCDDSGDIGISYVYNIGFQITVKIWGYA